MKNINKVILIGNVGNLPEIRTTNTGKTVVNFSLATNRTYKKDNEFKTDTEWHRIVTWNQYDIQKVNDGKIQKGTTLYVEGRLQTREWLKNDEKRYSTDIIAEVIGILKTNGSTTRETTQEQSLDLDKEDFSDPF